MPTFSYECKRCGQRLDFSLRMNDPRPEVHQADCGGELRRVYSAIPVRYGSSGFYSTDKALYGTAPGDYEAE